MTALELLLVFVVAGGGAYLGSYLREKGKNLATREDIEKITLITEQTKAEISRQLWEIQTRERRRHKGGSAYRVDSERHHG
jgi:hypothetical protein